MRARVKAGAVATRKCTFVGSPARTSDRAISAAAAGDRRAWESLVEQHAQQVWDVVRSVGLDEAVSATVLVLTFRRLADHLDEFRTDAEVRSWLCAAAGSEACKVCFDAWLSGEPARPSEAL
jgi:hypothetical protein